MVSWACTRSASSFSRASMQPVPPLKYLHLRTYFSRNFSATMLRAAECILSPQSVSGHVSSFFLQKLHTECQYLHCITGGNTTTLHERHSILRIEVELEPFFVGLCSAKYNELVLYSHN